MPAMYSVTEHLRKIPASLPVDKHILDQKVLFSVNCVL